MIVDKLLTTLGLILVGAVPLALLFLFFKPRRFKPPKDISPSAMSEALREPLEEAYREPLQPYPWQIPGKPEMISDRDETFGQWLGRRVRNRLVLDVYLLLPLAGFLAVILVLILLAIFN